MTLPSIASVDAAACAERLARACRFRTISAADRPPAQAELQALREFLAEAFPSVHRVLQREVVNGSSLLFTWPGRSAASRQPVVLAGHLDVVPAETGTESRWQHPPFAGRIADGCIWGRGAVDDKAAVLALFEAVEWLLQRGFEPSRTIILAFGHDEETGGETGAKRMAVRLLARGVAAEWVLDEGGGLYPGLVPGVEAPLAAVGIAEKGRAVVRVKAGRAVELEAAVSRLLARPLPPRFTRPIRDFLSCVGPLLPWPLRLIVAHPGLFRWPIRYLYDASPSGRASLRTTLSRHPNADGSHVSGEPGTLHADLLLRVLPGDSRATIGRRLRRIIGDPRVRVEIRDDTWLPPVDASPWNTAGFACLARTIREVWPGALVAPTLTLGTTDARHYRAISPNLYRFAPLMQPPGGASLEHAVDERIPVDVHARGVQFFIRLLQNVASPTPG